jgi:tetratricopeptide (TPR) repeat protein
MNTTGESEIGSVFATDGEIAVINLQSAREQSWFRFWRDSLRAGLAETIIEQEHFVGQFLGDFDSLDRLEGLAAQLTRDDPRSARTELVLAQVAGSGHRFTEAREHLLEAVRNGAPRELSAPLKLSIDQACGDHLDRVLEERRSKVEKTHRLEDLVPLGALLADLREFDEADRTYRQAFSRYSDVSPFALTWVCFQIGVLWGELVPEPDSDRAAEWYERAISFLPRHVKARVHLAEVRSEQGRVEEAEELLVPALPSGDPEVSWRLADLMSATGRHDQAEVQMQTARSGFERLLTRHPLAFADHGAEFYAGSGNNPKRAFELASANAANRPTLRAFEQAIDIGTDAAEPHILAEIISSAVDRWGSTSAFQQSPIASLNYKLAHA